MAPRDTRKPRNWISWFWGWDAAGVRTTPHGRETACRRHCRAGWLFQKTIRIRPVLCMLMTVQACTSMTQGCRRVHQMNCRGATGPRH